MAAVPAAAGLSIADLARAAQSSKIDGVQIGAITYCFRGAPARGGVLPADMPAAMQKIGLSEVELMSGDAEIIAGIPQAAAGGGGFGGPGGRGGSGRGGGRGAGNVQVAPNGCPANTPSGQDSMAKSGQAPARGGGFGGGRALTPEQEAAQKAAADWRKAANASTWKGVRQKFNDAGIDVQILCYNMSQQHQRR